MNTVLWIILVFVALLGGFYGGAYFSRKQIEKELAENPRLNVDAVRTMMSAAGQKCVKHITKLSNNKNKHLQIARKNNGGGAGT